MIPFYVCTSYFKIAKKAIVFDGTNSCCSKMLEAWIENCPRISRDIELLECMKCEYFIRIDFIFIVCGCSNRYTRRRKTYRDDGAIIASEAWVKREK